MIDQLDTLAYTNRLRRLSPGCKLLFAVALMLIVLVSHPPVQIAAFVWISIWIVAYARIPWRVYLVGLVLACSFLAAGMPALLVEAAPSSGWSSGANVLAAWQWGGWVIYVTTDGVDRAVTLMCRSLAALSCLYFVLFTVPFAELLQVLRRIGLPVVLTDLVMLMYRLGFVFLETAAWLRTAQIARGGYQGIRAALRDTGRLVSRLFARAMLRYRQLYLGMMARGFTEDFRVVSLSTHVRSKRHEREALVGCVLLAAWEWWIGG
ncbi:cobalt ECF transporter T component CbiQ [Brevibacillus aydinogluensis]|jgi:cobalt/nickel transport system permease protein|uniref:Cobalt ECF transporter T component CbiQ n=1 Tax=Brevibacillus aydinogluensis TaxID=927786 RepID=A0AA48M6R0_9BACL|nr:cobalt ECF transporter T component CbiQ [Brevibacillus aydinogluensis]CAJ1001332.1 cobalt ECF transporter T component CbiQ [Brevibacillus aydinogluensis]